MNDTDLYVQCGSPLSDAEKAKLDELRAMWDHAQMMGMAAGLACEPICGAPLMVTEVVQGQECADLIDQYVKELE